MWNSFFFKEIDMEKSKQETMMRKERKKGGNRHFPKQSFVTSVFLWSNAVTPEENFPCPSATSARRRIYLDWLLQALKKKPILKYL